MRRILFVAASALALAASRPIAADGAEDEKGAWRRHYAVLILGLPGDAAHEEKFAAISQRLVTRLAHRGMCRENIFVLGPNASSGQTDASSGEKASRGSTAESIAEVFTSLRKQLQPEDSLWVIFVGHADHDGEHARFHIPGPDLRAVDYADLLGGVLCREQVLWLTMSSSGWFLEPLSRPGRIVITATIQDAEPNETEFPDAMAEALGLPDSELDADASGDVTVLELFAKIDQLVADRYRADDRAATEHAMIDDMGDGRGTEWKEISAERERISQSEEEVPPVVDGELASNTVVAPLAPETAEGLPESTQDAGSIPGKSSDDEAGPGPASNG